MSGPAVIAALAFVCLAPVGALLIRRLQAHRDRQADSDRRADLAPGQGRHANDGRTVVRSWRHRRRRRDAPVGVPHRCYGRSSQCWPLPGWETIDDLKGLKDAEGVGWLARVKFPWQWAVALALAGGMYLSGSALPMWLPFTERVWEPGIWFVPVGAFLIVGWVNAANLTDGLDGLAAGSGVLVVVCLATLAVGDGHSEVGYWSMAFAGALLAFLWHNVHPARVIMGDVGAESLGAALATMALVSGHMVLLLLAGAPMLAEALSVMIQVGYFKYTRRRYGEGRRVFRRAPLHHHFEALGYTEVQITLRFWIATAVTCLLALALRGAV